MGVDSNPKVTWGKYFKQDDRVLMPFSVQVHHGLMDGLHVGRYFEMLQRYIDELTWLGSITPKEIESDIGFNTT